jgi:hypothetical protein
MRRRAYRICDKHRKLPAELSGTPLRLRDPQTNAASHRSSTDDVRSGDPMHFVGKLTKMGTATYDVGHTLPLRWKYRGGTGAGLA